jgi:hypothetical protein
MLNEMLNERLKNVWFRFYEYSKSIILVPVLGTWHTSLSSVLFRPRVFAGCGASPHFSNNLNKSKYSEIGLKWAKIWHFMGISCKTSKKRGLMGREMSA